MRHRSDHGGPATRQAGLEETFAFLDSALDAAAKSAKSIPPELTSAKKAAVTGDVAKLQQSARELSATAAKLAEHLRYVQELTETDFAKAIASVSYAEEIARLAEARGVAGVRVLDGAIHAYPVALETVAGEPLLHVGKTAIRTIRPSALVAALAKLRSKKAGQPVNQRLLDAIEATYLEATGGHFGHSIRLDELHRRLTPLPQQRTAYQREAFVRDLFELERAGITTTKSGHRVSFPASTSSKGAQTVRLIGPDGRERLYASIRFD